MKTFKTLLFLATCMMASFSYAYEQTIDGINYAIYSDEAIVLSNQKCSGDIVIPDFVCGLPVTEIKEYAFEGDEITSVIIGNKVKKIYQSAFRDCKKLKKITLGKSVEYIQGYSSGSYGIPGYGGWTYYGAFKGCNKIETINSLIERLFPIDESVFEGEVYYNAQLLVPLGQKEKYLKAKGWNNFLSIEEVDFLSKHNLTFLLDGEIFQQYQLGYEEKTISPNEDPYKLGYSFSGWEGIPDIMPATDVTISASFIPKNEVRVFIHYGCATFYHGGAAYSLPPGLSAKVITGIVDNKISYKTIADGNQENNVVPKGVPVMLVSQDESDYIIHLQLSQSDVTYNGPNLLRSYEVVNSRTIIAKPGPNECVYKLCMYEETIDNKVQTKYGWYWGAENGGSFSIINGSSGNWSIGYISSYGYKAWLAVPTKNNARSYAINTDEINKKK